LSASILGRQSLGRCVASRFSFDTRRADVRSIDVTIALGEPRCGLLVQAQPAVAVRGLRWRTSVPRLLAFGLR
jgi:hypothetical protein